MREVQVSKLLLSIIKDKANVFSPNWVGLWAITFARHLNVLTCKLNNLNSTSDYLSNCKDCGDIENLMRKLCYS